jgi:lysine 6-dehydrogenase
MRLGLLGAGQQGIACALDWLNQPDVREVRVFDADEGRLQEMRRRFPDPRLTVQLLDVGHAEELVQALSGCDAALSAVPYFLNVAVTRAAIQARTPLVDLGGNVDVVFQQRALDPEARAAGIGILPDQGLAPGLAGILAVYGWRDFDQIDSARLWVGGLPQRPRGPLSYALVFSIHGLLNEYSGEAVVLEEGAIRRRPTLTGRESIRFPHPVGLCEAAFTSGGTSTLPWTFEGKVRELSYKTVRYPGHWERIAFLKDLGFLETRPVPAGRTKIPPRELLAALLEPLLTDAEVRDLVVLRVRVRGRRDGARCLRQYDMVDFFDEATGLTAMMRTTAFPASESALLLGRRMIPQRGVLAAEQVIPGAEYLRRLRERGLAIREIESTER